MERLYARAKPRVPPLLPLRLLRPASELLRQPLRGPLGGFRLVPVAPDTVARRLRPLKGAAEAGAESLRTSGCRGSASRGDA